MPQEPFRIVVLASGAGTTFGHLARTFGRASAGRRVDISALICNRPGAGVLDVAARHNVTAITEALGGSTRQEHEARIAAHIVRIKPDLIVLAGYDRILTGTFIRLFRGKIINTHPSLLPRHGGPGMHGERVHAAVIASGDRQSGASVHFVTEDVDGGPIIAQEAVEITGGETIDTLKRKVQALEKPLLEKAIMMIAQGGAGQTGRASAKQG